jgi:hypothetical protein
MPLSRTLVLGASGSCGMATNGPWGSFTRWQEGLPQPPAGVTTSHALGLPHATCLAAHPQVRCIFGHFLPLGALLWSCAGVPVWGQRGAGVKEGVWRRRPAGSAC